MTPTDDRCHHQHIQETIDMGEAPPWQYTYKCLDCGDPLDVDPEEYAEFQAYEREALEFGERGGWMPLWFNPEPVDWKDLADELAEALDAVMKWYATPWETRKPLDPVRQLRAERAIFRYRDATSGDQTL